MQVALLGEPLSPWVPSLALIYYFPLHLSSSQALGQARIGGWLEGCGCSNIITISKIAAVNCLIAILSHLDYQLSSCHIRPINLVAG